MFIGMWYNLFPMLITPVGVNWTKIALYYVATVSYGIQRLEKEVAGGIYVGCVITICFTRFHIRCVMNMRDSRLDLVSSRSQEAKIEKEKRIQEHKYSILKMQISKVSKELAKLNSAWEPVEPNEDQEIITSEAAVEEEMPTDSGYPAYMAARLASFNEHAGKV